MSVDKKLGIDLAKDPNAAQKICQDAVDRFAKEQGDRFSMYAARDFYDAAVEMMSASINKEALAIMAGTKIVSSKGEGWFEIGENDQWEVNGRMVTFAPGVMLGAYFESLLFGAGVGFSEESSEMPDLFTSALANEFLRNLSSTEVKTEDELKLEGAAGVSVGKFSVPAALVKGWVQNAKGEFSPVIDEIVMRTFSVLKILEKMVSVIVASSEIDKTSAKGVKIFHYLFARLYAKLKIKEIAAAFKVDMAAGYFGKPHLQGKMARVKAEEKAQMINNNTWGKKNIGVDIPFNLAKKDPQGNLMLYDEVINLWTDDASRRAFFLAMQESEKAGKSMSINQEIQKFRKEYRAHRGKQ
jgi:hypothetical protein